MRWSAKFEGIQHATEAGLYIFVVVAEDVEGFVHDVRIVVADGTRTDFVAVHDHVVLVGFDCELFLIGFGFF